MLGDLPSLRGRQALDHRDARRDQQHHGGLAGAEPDHEEREPRQGRSEAHDLHERIQDVVPAPHPARGGSHHEPDQRPDHVSLDDPLHTGKHRLQERPAAHEERKGRDQHPVGWQELLEAQNAERRRGQEAVAGEHGEERYGGAPGSQRGRTRSLGQVGSPPAAFPVEALGASRPGVLPGGSGAL